MIITGIVAEYNPFHNGHQYQLQESRRLTGADFTVVVMSGNFVQRGAPALIDKRFRTEMALRCGADLVLELPVLYATASSEYFAAGAAALLDKLGVVTHLCFGSECGDIDALRQIAAFLAEEPDAYRTALKQLLKQGFSYPDARAKALTMQSALPKKERETQLLLHALPDNCAEILSCPNNILGIDYIKELLKRKSNIVPITVKRRGAGYHDLFTPVSEKNEQNSNQGETTASTAPYKCQIIPGNICQSKCITSEHISNTAQEVVNDCAHKYNSTADADFHASALALRQALSEEPDSRRLRPYMPEEAWHLLHAYLSESTPLYPDSLSNLLYYKLLLERNTGYEKYLDVSADLSNRIRNNLSRFTGFLPFCDLLKTKALTHTRISRCLLHILLDIEKEDMRLGKAQDYTPYARVLGFRRSARPLLHAIGAHSAIPLITKLADARKNLPADADRLLRQDILASEIYKGIAYSRSGQPAPNEYSTPLVIL